MIMIRMMTYSRNASISRSVVILTAVTLKHHRSFDSSCRYRADVFACRPSPHHAAVDDGGNRTDDIYVTCACSAVAVYLVRAVQAARCSQVYQCFASQPVETAGMQKGQKHAYFYVRTKHSSSCQQRIVRGGIVSCSHHPTH